MVVGEVVVLRWPGDAARRGELRRSQQARLWLVEAGAAAPERLDWLEDWVRTPAPESDLTARSDNLAARARAAAHPTPHPALRAGGEAGGGAARPVLDDDGVLRHERAWVSLPPVEHRLVEAMVARFGAVVTREALGAAGWPAGSPGRNALDVHVLRLRRRLRPLGLEIRTVRSRGYLLEAAAGAHPIANLA